jgi:hypothetical protein
VIPPWQSTSGVAQVLELQNHSLVFFPDGQMVMLAKFEIAPTSRTITTRYGWVR